MKKHLLPLLAILLCIFLTGAAVPGGGSTSDRVDVPVLLSSGRPAGSPGSSGNNWGKAAIVVAVCGFVFLRYFRVYHKTRQKYGKTKSYYKRKNFRSERRAFDVADDKDNLD